jgi:hypothetical protein
MITTAIILTLIAAFLLTRLVVIGNREMFNQNNNNEYR